VARKKTIKKGEWLVQLKTKAELEKEGWYTNNDDWWMEDILIHKIHKGTFDLELEDFLGTQQLVNSHGAYSLYVDTMGEGHCIPIPFIKKVIKPNKKEILIFPEIEYDIEVHCNGTVTVGCNSMTPEEAEKFFITLGKQLGYTIK